MTKKKSKILKFLQITIVLYAFLLKMIYDCFIVNTIKISVYVINQTINESFIFSYAIDILFFTKFIAEKSHKWQTLSPFLTVVLGSEILCGYS